MRPSCPPGAERTGAPARDRGDIILGWLVRLVAVLGLAGLVAFDAISVASASLSLEDQAVAAARDASDALARLPTAQAAYDAGLASAVASDPANELHPQEMLVAPGQVVTLTLHRTAPTLVLHRIGPVRHWAERSATATAAPLP